MKALAELEKRRKMKEILPITQVAVETANRFTGKTEKYEKGGNQNEVDALKQTVKGILWIVMFLLIAFLMLILGILT